VRAVPRLCELYPGICLTTEEKARKNLSYGSRKVPRYPGGSIPGHIHTNNTQNNTMRQNGTYITIRTVLYCTLHCTFTVYFLSLCLSRTYESKGFLCFSVDAGTKEDE
jgi:hypothetical protein